MYFKQFYDEDLAQSSYLIGCPREGTAIVVDARRDIAGYLEEAQRQEVVITSVTETHTHADYLSGSRELAAATGAKVFLSDEGDENWKYSFGDVALHDGDAIRLGNIRLDAIHTPGHTPEHMSFLITDLATSEIPTILLTGDFVFVGDVGRPDLLDEAAGFVDTRFAGAKDLFDSLRDRFLVLPDHVQVWPGHGAGSACGKSLGAVPSTTVGYERLTAWWAPYVLNGDERGFTETLLAGQPDAPTYFGRMKRDNKRGPAVLGDREALPKLDPARLAAELGDDVLVVDTRSAARFREDTVAGSLFVPDGKNFVTYASYAIDPDQESRSLVLLANTQDTAHRLRDELSRVGIDRIAGYVETLEGLPRKPVPSVAPSDLDRLDDPLVLDVRAKTEYEEGHIPGAKQLHVGRLRAHLDDLPVDRPIVVHCEMGGRAAVAEGILHAAGFENVIDLKGSYAAWKDAQAELA
jgi:hydroxyacylglutathione hydrolase